MMDLTKLYKNPWASVYSGQAKDAGGGFEAPAGQDFRTGGNGYYPGTGVTSFPGQAGQQSTSAGLPQDFYSKYASPKGTGISKVSWDNKPYAANVGQDWYGDAYWNPIGTSDTLYNSTYGWQPEFAIRDMYEKATGPVTEEDFKNWGLTYGDFTGFSDNPSPGSGSPSSSTPFPGSKEWIEWMKTRNVPVDLSGIMDSGDYSTPEPTDYGFLGQDTYNQQNPWQWNQAGDTFNQFAQGQNATPDPTAWGTSENYLNQLLGSGGMPTSYAPAYQASKSVVQRDIENAIKQSTEEAGLSGMRWSTPLGRTAQETAANKMGELGANWTTQELGAQEAAMQRMLSGSSQLSQLGGQQAQLWEAPKDRAMQAASGLSGLGTASNQYGMDLASQAYGMGTTQYGQDNAALQQSYQDVLRTAPENNPYLNMIYQMATGQGIPQQYNQGAGSQLLSAASNIGGMAAGGCLGK